MILFYTKSTQHLVSRIALAQGKHTVKQFSDGELWIHVDEEEVKNKKVWVIAATHAPAEHLLELFFLLDALQRAGAHINVLFTYFGYARQVDSKPGQACSAQVIAMLLKNFNRVKTYIIHPHSQTLHNYLSFTEIHDIPFFCTQAEDYDVIAAPDTGARVLAQEIAQRCNKEVAILTKIRPDHDTVAITAIDGSVAHKKVLLVDDIISTGRTLAQAAQTLKKAGAHTVAAAATHGIFSADAYSVLEKSVIEKIVVTNTIAQKPHGKITVHDVGPFIEDVIQLADTL